MDRKKFLKNSVLGLGGFVALTSTVSCSDDDDNTDFSGCTTSPAETDGPFPIKTPADLVRENVIGNRSGIPLMINITIQNTNNECMPMEGVFVDIWHCDAKGNYSEYSGQVEGDFTNENFLRGRQTTNAAGQVSFLSIYPGWYPGRAPHIHVEVKRSNNTSLLISQIAFPETTSNTVYTTSSYNGDFDTSNSADGEFNDSLSGNMADSVTGNNTDGYVLNKVIKVAG